MFKKTQGMKYSFLKSIFIILLILSISTIIGFSFYKKNAGKINVFPFAASEKNIKKGGGEYYICAPELPDFMDFAGDEIPMADFDVYESLDREILTAAFWHSYIIQAIKRANKFFPIIEPILKKNNVPEDMKYIAVAESSLRNVSSPAGAKGFWQFMKKTAQHYELEVNDFVDERYNLVLATEAACKYLKNGYRKYKDWALVAASYNAGMGRIDKELKKQKVDNYFDLRLNEETARYVFRILAIKYIMTNPEKYGLCIDEKLKYKMCETEVLTVDTTINNLVDFAQNKNTNYKILKLLNPWLRDYSLPNKSKKKYEIIIPAEDGRKVYDFE